VLQEGFTDHPSVEIGRCELGVFGRKRGFG
jgi:hypothetical protein